MPQKHAGYHINWGALLESFHEQFDTATSISNSGTVSYQYRANRKIVMILRGAHTSTSIGGIRIEASNGANRTFFGYNASSITVITKGDYNTRPYTTHTVFVWENNTFTINSGQTYKIEWEPYEDSWFLGTQVANDAAESGEYQYRVYDPFTGEVGEPQLDVRLDEIQGVFENKK